MSKFLAVALALLPALVQAQLQARDIDGNGSIDAFYDVQQNISWLADANYYLTSGGPLVESAYSWPGNPNYLAPGQVRLSNALSFVDNLVVAGLDGWRLPQRLIPAGDPTGTILWCNTTRCSGDFLWPDEVSVLATSMDGAGPFLNVQSDWGYLAYTAGPNYAQLSNPISGWHFGTDETSIVWGYVWAVHDGDVGVATNATVAAPVPEPGTYALMLSALAVLCAVQRRRASRELRTA